MPLIGQFELHVVKATSFHAGDRHAELGEFAFGAAEYNQDEFGYFKMASRIIQTSSGGSVGLSSFFRGLPRFFGTVVMSD